MEKKFYIYYLAGYPVSGKIIGRISGQISIRYNPRYKKGKGPPFLIRQTILVIFFFSIYEGVKCNFLFYFLVYLFYFVIVKTLFILVNTLAIKKRSYFKTIWSLYCYFCWLYCYFVYIVSVLPCVFFAIEECLGTGPKYLKRWK